ncbi:hypothetical protein HK405_000607, partial [Cladochytrium tenue]
MPPFVETLCALTALAASGNFSSYLMASWHKGALVAAIAAAISEVADTSGLLAEYHDSNGRRLDDPEQLALALVLSLARGPGTGPAFRYSYDGVRLAKYIPFEYLARECEACCNALFIGYRAFDDEDEDTPPRTELASLSTVEVARLPGRTLVETGDLVGFGRFHIPVERPEDPDFDYIEEFACPFEPSSSPDEANALINL